MSAPLWFLWLSSAPNLKRCSHINAWLLFLLYTLRQCSSSDLKTSWWPHLDEVKADAVISLHRNQSSMLRDDLQTLKGFTVTSGQHLRTETQKWSLLDHTFENDWLINVMKTCDCAHLSQMCCWLVVRATAMFSQALQCSPRPGASQPSWLQHSSNTARHLSSADTHRRPSFLKHDAKYVNHSWRTRLRTLESLGAYTTRGLSLSVSNRCGLK